MLFLVAKLLVSGSTPLGRVSKHPSTHALPDKKKFTDDESGREDSGEARLEIVVSGLFINITSP